MTVSYNLELSRIGLSTPFRLLLRWRGSVLKVMYKEALIFFSAYGLLSVLYRCVLKEEEKRIFESAAIICRSYMSMIPVNFILGFYVSVVFTRWQNILNALPWIDSPTIYLSFLTGSDAKARLYRRSIIRYMVASQVLCFRALSVPVMKRFPTMDHIVDAHLLSEEEMKTVELAEAPAGDTKYWLPCLWAINVLHRARLEGRIASDMLLTSTVEKVNSFRVQMSYLLMYDWINIPLVYTQLISIALWSYFAAAAVGEQWLDSSSELVNEPPIDLYIPLFTGLQFICLVGWLRVAQNMLNPMGEKDDDIELNYMIDRNLQLGLLAADELHGGVPELRPDEFMEDDCPELPHTDESRPFAGEGWQNSAASACGERSSVRPSRASSIRTSVRSKLSTFHSRVARSASLRSSLRRLSRQVSMSSRASVPVHHGHDELHSEHHGEAPHDFQPMETLTEESEAARKITSASVISPPTIFVTEEEEGAPKEKKIGPSS